MTIQNNIVLCTPEAKEEYDGMVDKDSIIVNEDIKKILILSSLSMDEELKKMVSSLQSVIQYDLFIPNMGKYDSNTIRELVLNPTEISNTLLKLNMGLVLIIISYVIESGIVIKNNIDFRELLLKKFLEHKVYVNEEEINDDVDDDIYSLRLGEERTHELTCYYLTSYNNIHIISDKDENKLGVIGCIDDLYLGTTTKFIFYKTDPDDGSDIIETDLAKICYEIFEYFMNAYKSSSKFRKTKSAMKIV